MNIQKLFNIITVTLSRSVSFLLFFIMVSSYSCKTTTPSALDQWSIEKQKKAEIKLNEAVARVNGVEINRRTLNAKVAYIAPRIIPHSNVRKERMKKFEIDALEELIEEELLYREAIVQDIKIEEDAINKEIDKIKKGLPEDVTLDSILKGENQNIDWLKDIIKKPKMIDKLKTRMEKKFKNSSLKTVNEEYAKKFYEKNKAKLIEPAQIKLREILIKVDPGSPKEGWDKAKKLATWIIERANKGDDFAELAKEFSNDEFAEKGGDLGYIKVGIGKLHPELEHVATGLDVGGVGGPVMTLYGFHILKSEEKIPYVQKKFDEVKESITKRLVEQERKKLWSDWSKGLKDNAKIEYLDEDSEVWQEE